MIRYLTIGFLGTLLAVGTAAAEASFQVEKLSDGVYAALARVGSRASSNLFFVVGDRYVVAGGAHLSREGAADLLAAIATVSDRPLRFFIIPHHHRGVTAVDFDLPANCEAIMSVETWQALTSEARSITYPVIYYSEGMTLKPGNDKTIILTDLGKGHAEGDTLVYLPESKVLFASDLVYARSVGYLGDGHMTDWVLALDFMAGMDVKTVIPGYGPVSSPEVILEFRDYLKAFLSEILKHLEKGDSLAQTRKEFRLDRYRDWAGYNQLTDANIERAYRDLKTNFLNRN